MALLWRSYSIYKKTGINALTQSNQDSFLKFLAIVFKIHLIMVLGLVGDYVFDYNVLTGNRFDFVPIRFTASIGSLLLFLCFITIITAQNHMKTSWRIEIDTRSATRLIETGFFRFSRNPIFLALRLSYFAMFLIVPCPYSLLTFLIGDLAFQAQVRQEEQHLSNAHGAIYLHYCSRVPRWL
ncbi:MAG: isoprenylcysteine carboxylmethyltransferase family protein [Nitrospirota bacterium]|nr:isoprenylcysteine carboxylmethyltransferase family protein [Nitrospirota bacterium]